MKPHAEKHSGPRIEFSQLPGIEISRDSPNINLRRRSSHRTCQQSRREVILLHIRRTDYLADDNDGQPHPAPSLRQCPSHRGDVVTANDGGVRVLPAPNGNGDELMRKREFHL